MTAMNTYRLYDVFIHYLIDREVSKKGRYPKFEYYHRRKFAELLAWWLWKAGGASTTTQSDIPADLLRIPVANVRHEFDEEGLRRELVIGCMVEKAGGGIFFPHRSIQEFLVAEHIWSALSELRDREFLEAAIRAARADHERPAESSGTFGRTRKRAYSGLRHRQRTRERP